MSLELKDYRGRITPESDCVPATLVELVNGEFVLSDAESWRAQCEACYVLAKPLDERRRYLADIETKRGKSGADYLRETMTRVHAKARAQ